MKLSELLQPAVSGTGLKIASKLSKFTERKTSDYGHEILLPSLESKTQAMNGLCHK